MDRNAFFEPVFFFLEKEIPIFCRFTYRIPVPKGFLISGKTGSCWIFCSFINNVIPPLKNDSAKNKQMNVE